MTLEDKEKELQVVMTNINKMAEEPGVYDMLDEIDRGNQEKRRRFAEFEEKRFFAIGEIVSSQIQTVYGIRVPPAYLHQWLKAADKSLLPSGSSVTDTLPKE